MANNYIMNPIIKYLQETRAELRHVAWPTQMQTIVYTIIVALLSIGVALYLGLFDYIFTTSLTRAIAPLPARSSIQVTQEIPAAPAGSTEQPTSPLIQGSQLKIIPSDTNQTTPTPSTGSGQAN